MPDDVITYRIQVVGGPYDGAPGMYWLDDGEHPPPERIFLGTCPGDASCGSPRCRPRRRHHTYWTDPEAVPMKTMRYEREDTFIERPVGTDPDGTDTFEGVAIYAVGGLDMFRPMRVQEAVPAGAV